MVEKFSTATIVVAVFGIVICILQKHHTRVSLSFAMFLAAVSLNNIPDAFYRVFQSLPPTYFQISDLLIWLPSGLCIAPLFWIYVFTLTSETQQRPKRLYRHFLLPALMVAVGLIALTSPREIGNALFSADAPQLTGGVLTLAIVFGILQAALFPQIAIYLFLILRRMARHRLVLRDYYASTEKHELRWLYVIGALGIVFWIARTLIFVLLVNPDAQSLPPYIYNVVVAANLSLIAALTVWGLRQRPPFTPPVEQADLSEPVEQVMPQTVSEKYEKSALNPEVSDRIARKLRAAMEKERLHRDPNLSLWTLAQHIGASSNYISQTLNEVIGESFFDFVNGYRIDDAKTLLTSTNSSVLAIAYEVGFNARSSFYNAFKRVTGQTPSNYRKMLSHPVGTDD